MANGSQGTTLGQGFVRLILVKPFFEYVRVLGLRPETVLDTFALDRAAVEDPERLVHAEVVYGIFNALAKQANDPHLGFHVGERERIEEWPPFLKAVEQAQSLGEFLSHFIEGIPREASSVRYSLSITEDGAVFSCDRLFEPKVNPKHTEGFGVSQFAEVFKRACGEAWDPAQMTVCTRFVSAVPQRPYGLHLQSKAEGGLEFRFPSAWLFRPIDFTVQMPAPSKGTATTEAEVSLLRAFQSAARPLLTRLDLGLDEVAAALGLPPARLARALKTAGTSPAHEIRRLRLEEAKLGLSQGRKVSELAHQFGYSDPAHFTRFFRSQTGMSPRAYLEGQRQHRE